MTRAALVLLVPLSLAACSHLGGIPLPGPRGQGSKQLERKVVADKIEPQELVAYDGTRCVTTVDRYRKTALGQRVWCVWNRGPTPTATEGTGRVGDGWAGRP